MNKNKKISISRKELKAFFLNEIISFNNLEIKIKDLGGTKRIPIKWFFDNSLNNRIYYDHFTTKKNFVNSEKYNNRKLAEYKKLIELCGKEPDFYNFTFDKKNYFIFLKPEEK